MDTIVETRTPLSACISLPRAAAFVQWLVALWRDKGVEVNQLAPDRVQLVLPEIGWVALEVAGSRQLHCQIQTATAAMGETMQLSVTEYLGEYAEEMAWPDGSWDIVWAGHAPRSPAQLQVLQVVSNRALSPLMRRLRLQGDRVQAFADGGLHVRLVLPVPGQAPAWPVVLGDGRLQWGAGETRLARRTYTIRAIDSEALWMDVDVLLHLDSDAPSPGASWAAQAQPGSSVGVISPASGLALRAAHYVMVADACALPAAARLLQAAAPFGEPALLLWVADASERSAFDVPADVVQPQWICSGEPGASAPEIAQVLDWLAQQDWQRADTVCWVAGGLPLTQAVRRWMAERRQDPTTAPGLRVLVHTYWR